MKDTDTTMVLRAVLRFFASDRYRAASDVKLIPELTMMRTQQRSQLLTTLALPGVGLLKKHLGSGRRDSAYRLTAVGKYVLDVLENDAGKQE